MNVMYILYVALGGAIGSVLRYLMQTGIGRWIGVSFPYGTFVVNVTGSFVMGIFIALLARAVPERSEDIRVFVAVGILGGYTTFSSFSLDAITLMENGEWVSMGLYVLGSVVLALLGLFAGLQLVRVVA